ncbi:cyclic peptide export ABC transporter [Parachitinimonas caeni]|uniref:Cyclic peptide export ABC transporter n=1 Tax=Parachitinimonas caeni TaxID=3031301 RepID=A0ABT7DWG5_9NEIS|nr:cyclic peptide export ABC transporter [Parachitinimonas caeni]MDK2124400.1 cyclic peptide export ABC transporter [Parachitinimonas caeni]
MKLFQLLARESKTSLPRLGMMAAVAGGSNAAVLAIVNQAAAMLGKGGSQFQAVVLFGLAVFAYVYAQRYVLLVTAEEVENVVHRQRQGLIDKLHRSELAGIEHIGRGLIFNAITADTQVISQTANGLVLGVQAVILIIWAAIYLAAISPTSLILVVLILGIAAQIYRRKILVVKAALQKAGMEQGALHDLVSGILEGFKEVKLSTRRAYAVIADAAEASARTSAFRKQAQGALAAHFIFAQVSFFVLLGAVVFIMPTLVPSYSETIMKTLTAVMFLIGPISGVMTAVPQMAVANAAAENIQRLSDLLDDNLKEPLQEELAHDPRAPQFSRLELRHAYFRHASGDNRFSVGPINLTVNAGEVIFITGGNGSGKTTFLKMLTALYPCAAGEIVLDGVGVTREHVQAYRDLFCGVFADFHLFAKFYGVAMPSLDEATRWTERMEIAEKVRILPDRFSTTDLSTGQRKRLAYIAAVFENKPIIILDEWAADQDPHFRAKFYNELIPELKAMGKTVIAITHDDRYFHQADRRLHMDEGRLTELTKDAAHE